jgi:hypothetical protein
MYYLKTKWFEASQSHFSFLVPKTEKRFRYVTEIDDFFKLTARTPALYVATLVADSGPYRDLGSQEMLLFYCEYGTSRFHERYHTVTIYGKPKGELPTISPLKARISIQSAWNNNLFTKMRFINGMEFNRGFVSLDDFLAEIKRSILHRSPEVKKLPTNCF